ncbi:hypothetical protein IFM89_011612 [Coptis chinensis]|uniref:Uncharacterized protein n=1 Tax=Coptis chinensis TaxID=261450 RepID=A0A835LHK8_9MAGN|nr:hypothetical protein IFM89_011612 [Coptis chinensis]
MVLLWQPSYIQSLVGKAKVDIELDQSFKKLSCSTVLSLAYQCLGVVYGDLSRSSLYVYKTDFLGKLSLRENSPLI